MLQKLRVNLAALDITVIETQVEWDDAALIRFFSAEGFAPAPQVCLQLRVRPERR